MRVYYGTKVIRASRLVRDDQEGYAVEYADGYKSWSPKDVFEAAYQPMDKLSFGHAIYAMERGHKVSRAGWNGKGMWIAMQRPDAYSKMNLPYVYMKTITGELVPWLCSQTDMFAKDWCILGNDDQPLV